MFTILHAQNAAFGLQCPAKKKRPDNGIGNKSIDLLFLTDELNEFSDKNANFLDNIEY